MYKAHKHTDKRLREWANMTARHLIKHTDLFLVRFWAKETNGISDGQSAWEGKVQRAVDGEAHEFGDWDALVAALRAMLAATSPRLITGIPNSIEPVPSEDPDKEGQE